MRNLGGAIGIAGCGTLLNDRTNLHFLREAEHLTLANPAVAVLVGPAGAADHAARLQRLWSLAFREAETQTFADTFLVIALCFALATAMVPLMRKVAAPAAPSAEAH
jgi:DHA2 family multidrug resistance protein